MTMIRYEIKKIFSKNSSRIALLILAAVLAVICVTTLRSPEIRYVNENGETETGIAAAHKLRDAKEEWTGPLTEERLEEAISEMNRINASPEARSSDIQQQDIAFSRGQGLMDIRDMLNDSFVEFGKYDYYMADTLTEKDAADFYTNRAESLSDWLYSGTGSTKYQDSEKEYLIGRYEEIETPFDYECADGWKLLIESSPMILMMMALVIIFLSSGIFSSEYSLKADAVFFSSRYGRDRAIRSKIFAGVITVSAVYAAVMILYTAVILGILGAGGGASPVQTIFGFWTSMYDFSIAGSYAIIVLCGYLGTVFISLLTMLISARSRSAVIAVVIPFVIVFLPLYLPDGVPALVEKIFALMPDQMLQGSIALGKLTVYGIGDMMAGAVDIMPFLYALLIIAALPLIYFSYRKTAVR